MAKLYFRYGVVSSAKTLNLLATLHNYEIQGKRAILIKPSVDTRSVEVSSRAGLSHKADIILRPVDNLSIELYPFLLSDKISAVLVDEVQFLTEEQILYLRKLSAFNDIPILCYGLRTKSDATLWKPIITLMAIADIIEEIKTTCTYCDRKAVFSKAVIKNMENASGVNLTWDGYEPVCPYHYYLGN